jgi:hypothetical protein
VVVEVEPALGGRRTRAAVNCFPTEPDWNIVRAVTGASSSTFARP